MLNESDLIEKLSKVKIFDSDLIIRGESITNLGEIERIKGTLGVNNSGIENLGNLIEIQKDFWISSHTVFSNLKSLDNLEVVGGDLNLRYSNISNLGSLKKVGGKLNLRDTPICDLGSLNYVGGDLFLPKRLQDSVNLNGVTIKGVIKYWNDDKKYIKPPSKLELGLIKSSRAIPKWSESNTFSLDVLDFDNREQKEFYIEFRNEFLNDVHIDIEGNDYYAFYLQNDLKENYSDDTDTFLNLYSKLTRHYPITKKYSHHAITNKLESNNNYSKAWELISQRPALAFETVIDYEKKIGVNLVDGAIIEKFSGHSHLTDFGQRNIEKIVPYADEVLNSNLKTKNKSFFNQFLKNGVPISHKATYYKKFFLSIAEYNHYKWIDESQAKSNYIRNIPHIVEKAIYSQCKQILKQAEDLYRASIGMPKVGEGWISETELYYKISDSFKDLQVLHHASPKWLGRQHLDIFIPKYKIGIEYQGARYYDSDIARFLSLDPLASKFPAWSAYNYVMGNPAILTDPSGKSPEKVDDDKKKKKSSTSKKAAPTLSQTASNLTKPQSSSNYFNALIGKPNPSVAKGSSTGKPNVQVDVPVSQSTIGNISVTTTASKTLDNGSSSTVIVSSDNQNLGTSIQSTVGTMTVMENGDVSFGNSVISAGINVYMPDLMTVNITVPVGNNSSSNTSITVNTRAFKNLMESVSSGFEKVILFIPLVMPVKAF